MQSGRENDGAQRQVAADVVVDGGARVGAHVERRDDPAVFAMQLGRRRRRRSAAIPGALQFVEVEPQHHAHVEQRLIAHRAAAEQVLDGLLVAVGRVGKLSLRQLFFDHRGLDLGEGRFARRSRHVGLHVLLPAPEPRGCEHNLPEFTGNSPSLGKRERRRSVRFPECWGLGVSSFRRGAGSVRTWIATICGAPARSDQELNAMKAPSLDLNDPRHLAGPCAAVFVAARRRRRRRRGHASGRRARTERRPLHPRLRHPAEPHRRLTAETSTRPMKKAAGACGHPPPFCVRASW